jgi:excisionase family DNA binding protein
MAKATQHVKVIYIHPNNKRITMKNEDTRAFSPERVELTYLSEYVTVKEASKISGRTVPSVYRWLKEGRLTRYKTGTGRTLIKREELNALITPRPADNSA